MGKATIRFRGGPWDGFVSKDFRESHLPDYFWVRLEPINFLDGELLWNADLSLMSPERMQGDYPFPYARRTRYGYHWGGW